MSRRLAARHSQPDQRLNGRPQAFGPRTACRSSLLLYIGPVACPTSGHGAAERGEAGPGCAAAGNVIEDMFTVNCPWPWKTNVDGPWLPGWSSKTGKRRLNLYTCNMTMFYQPERLGVMREIGFGQEFDNMVLETWQDPDMQSRTGYDYTRALQFQCVSVDDKVTFTGINFLSREPIVSQPMLQEMFVRARALGLEPYGSNDMHIVNHEDCDYPISTDRGWMGDRPEWPCPVVFTGDAGAEL
ncbi:unnamed protein product [Prorocentrum cordatum]|uniref:Amine oxidase n=1 Tax=Prorocentrum cordatum TaxID=2364126 RepID=A0ABN9U0R5_9DINO|nr:unnamed protein product [Polarella glacialis]